MIDGLMGKARSCDAVVDVRFASGAFLRISQGPGKDDRQLSYYRNNVALSDSFLLSIYRTTVTTNGEEQILIHTTTARHRHGGGAYAGHNTREQDVT